MNNHWTELRAHVARGPIQIRVPGLSPATVRLENADTLLIKLSDATEVLVQRAEVEELYELLDARSYIVEEDTKRQRDKAQWVFAVLSLVGDFEFCAHPSLFVLNRSGKLGGRDINRVFRVGPVGGIRWRGPASEPTLVVAITRLDKDNPYADMIHEGQLTYTGQGLYGDQELTGGNLALASSKDVGAPVYVLISAGRTYRFLGRAAVSDFGLATDLGYDQVPRFVYRYALDLLPSGNIEAPAITSVQTDPTAVIQSGKGTFRPKARLVQTLLGRELVSNEAIAILELVKNSYDADADQVTVRILPDQDSIEVEDDGHGMPFDIVQGSWLQPATDIKVRRSRSRIKGRRVLGNKGVGRFAASRLGNTIDLITLADPEAFPDAKPECVHVYVDWTVFDDPDAYLDQVPFDWQITKAVPPMRYGTKLVIQHLASDIAWTRERVYDLRLLLARMVAPFAGVRDFAIVLETPFRELNGEIVALPMLNHPHYSISGFVDNDGACHATFSSQRGEDPNVEFTIDKSNLTCGPFGFEFRVWNREGDDLQDLAALFETSVVKVRRELDKAAGVSIYRDGFRVLPYGEAKNDWLRLDARRVQNPTMHISNNQMVGAVFITGDENPLLRDQSNREGLMENRAVEDLRSAVLIIISTLEQRRYHQRPRRKPDDHTSIARFSLRDFRETLMVKYPNDTELIQQLDSKQSELVKQVDTVTRTVVQYRRLATLGRLVDMILHDGQHPLGVLLWQTEIARYQLNEAPKECFDSVIDQSLNTIAENGQWLSELFTRLEPLGGKERRPASNCIAEEVIRDTLKMYGQRVKATEVEVETPTSETTVFIDPSELQQVLVNLVDNSLHWLKTVDRRERRLAFKVVPGPDTVRVLVADSGPGVPAEHQEFIFDAYYTTKTENGKGLGLFIAAEILRENDGMIELVDYDALPGACFQITLKAGQVQ